MAQKKSGRPPLTRREDVLEAAFAIIQEDHRSFSIRRLAQRLGTSPSSIYNYFRNKDALLNELAETALAELWVQADIESDWQAGVQHWMERSLAALIANPALIELIGIAASSVAMVTKLQTLAALIQRAGLAERQSVQQAQSLLWEVVGFAILQLNASTPDVIERNSRVRSDPAYGHFGRHIAVDEFTELWQATIARSIAGIAALAKQTS